MKRYGRRQTLPALLIAPVLIALVALWAPARLLARELVRIASPRSKSALRKPGAVVLATGVLFSSLFMSAATPASAAIAYGGHLGSAVHPGCQATSDTVTSNDDNHVEENSPNTVNDPTHLDLHIHSKAGNAGRGFIDFPMPSVPANCQVASAVLNLDMQTFDVGRTIEVQRATAAWDESTITWNNQPAVTGPVATAVTAGPVMDFTLTQQVKDIYTGTNFGFRLRDSDETTSTDAKNEPYSKEEPGLAPELTISWEDIPQTSTTVTIGGAVPAGESVILSFGMEDVAGAISASDSAGNTYSLDVGLTNAGDVRGAILSAHDVTALSAGSTITVSHPAVGWSGFAAYRFSGISPNTPRDATGSGQGSSSSPASSAAATSQADELVFGSIGVDNASTFTPGGGFTGLPQVSQADGSVNSEYQIVSSAGSYSATGTLAASDDWTALVSTYRMDTTAPTVAVTSPTGGSSTNDATPTFSGTSGSYNSDSQTVTARVYLGVGTGGPLVQTLPTTRLANGDWSVTAASLPDAVYTVQATQADAAGNTGTSPAVSFTVDTAVPLAPAFSSTPPDGSSTTPSWSFTGEPGATFECRLDKGATPISGWASCTSPKSYTLVDGDGVYTFSVKQKDAAGNESPVATDDLTLDTAAPDTTIDSGPTGTVGNPDVSFTFSSDDPTATFQCQMDGDGFAACTSPLDYLGMADGSHTFQVRALDPVGNADATPAERTFVVDTSDPVAPTLNGPTQDPDDDDTPTWTFSGEPGNTFECKLEKDGSIVTDWTACTSPQTPTLSGDGDYTFSVREIDAGGNTSPVATDNYELDMTDPVQPSLTGPAPDPGRFTTVQWSFSGEGSATFECKLEKGALVVSDWTACTDPESYDLVDGDGVYTFSVRQTDPAGNTSPVATDTYDLDATDPETTIDSGPSGPVNTPDVSFTFSSTDPTATFECSLNGAPFAPCTSPEDLTDLLDGSYTFEVRAVDPVGNADPSPAASGFVVDTANPVAPNITEPDPNPSNDDMPSWTIGGEPGATFECKLEKDGVVLSDWLSCGSPVSYQMTDGDGTYTLHVRQTDPAGNVSPPETSDYVFDTEAPDAPTVTSPAPNPGNLTVPSWDFAGEPGATFECKLEKDGVEIDPFTPCVAPELYGLTDGDGDYVFTVRQTDTAGNVSAETSDTYTLDTTAAETTIDSGPTGTVATADVSFTFSSDDPTATFECNLDGSGFTGCPSPQDYTSLPDGDHTFQVRAVDIAGNKDDTPAEQTFTTDTLAPTVTIDSRPNDPGNDNSPTWTFSSEESPVTFECQLDGAGGPVAPWEPCDAQTMTYDLSSVPDETYTFRVRVSDAVGNTAVRTDTYLYDTTRPDSTVEAPEESNSATFTVNYSSGDSGGSGVDVVELWVKGPQDADFHLAGTDNTPNSPSFDFTADGGDGVYEFYTRATDMAGNQQNVQGAQAATLVDTIAPVVTITGGPSSPWTSTQVEFTFSVDDPSASAQCSLTADGSVAYVPCGSPVSYQISGVGDYTFHVRAIDDVGNVSNVATHTFTYSGEPSPTPSDSPSPTPSDSPSPTPSDSPIPTPSDSPSPTPSDSPSPTPSDSPSPTPSDSPSPTPSDSPSPTPSDSPSPTPSEEPSPTPTKSPRPTPTETPSEKPTEPPETPTPPDGEPPSVEPPLSGGSAPTVSGPYSDGDKHKDDGDPRTPPIPDGIYQPPTPEGPADLPDADGDPIPRHETQLEKLGRYAVEAVQRFAFPLILALAVVAFLAIQHWLDRKAPKLAYAPVHSRYDQVGFE